MSIQIFLLDFVIIITADGKIIINSLTQLGQNLGSLSSCQLGIQSTFDEFTFISTRKSFHLYQTVIATDYHRLTHSTWVWIRSE